MRSLHVRRRGEALFLMERDYPAQGISPYYTDLCRISPGEAATLLASRLVRSWDAGVAAEGKAGPVSGLVSLVDHGGRYRLAVTLPDAPPRERPFTCEVPGFDAVLGQLSDDTKRENFLRNTGVAFVGHAGARPLPA